MHEIREISDIRFMPVISIDKCLTLNFTDQSMKLQLSYEITFGYVQQLQIVHLIALQTINIVSFNKF